MNLLFVSYRSAPAVGGAETYLLELTRALARTHSVTVLSLGIDDAPATRLRESLAPPPPFEPFVDNGVRVVQLRLPLTVRAGLTPLVAQVVPGLRRYAYSRVRSLYALMYTSAVAPVLADAMRGFDVAQMWGPGLLAHATVHAAQAARIPAAVMASVHEGQWGDDVVSAAAYRAADAVVAQLSAEAAVYERLGVPAERISICGACSSGVAGLDGDVVRRRHRIDGPLVLFLGARRHYKGVDVLLDAAPIVSAALPDVTFAFVGPGAPLAAVSSARVLDVGEVNHAERARWLAAADVLCLPSAAESFGVVVLEAWSAQVPVVVSDVPALRELVASTGGGVAVTRDAAAIAGALLHLLTDDEARLTCGRAGYEAWRRRYTPTAVARRYEELYELLLAAPQVSRVAVPMGVPA